MKILFPLAAILFIVSCNEKNEKMAVNQIVHQIPTLFIQEKDSALSSNQDTVFFNNKLFSGKLFSLYENGDTALIECFWNGLQEGVTKKWYPHQQIAEYRSYIAGKKEGLQKTWWPNGNPKFEFIASNDAYEGVLKEWNEKGFMIKLFHYSKGQELGSQRLWWDDSTVRANYEIRNGKKYGLIGIKLCSNPYDSVNKK